MYKSHVREGGSCNLWFCVGVGVPDSLNGRVFREDGLLQEVVLPSRVSREQVDPVGYLLLTDVGHGLLVLVAVTFNTINQKLLGPFKWLINAEELTVLGDDLRRLPAGFEVDGHVRVSLGEGDDLVLDELPERR